MITRVVTAALAASTVASSMLLMSSCSSHEADAPLEVSAAGLGEMSCTRAPVGATIPNDGTPHEVASPASYGTSDCLQQWVVELTTPTTPASAMLRMRAAPGSAPSMSVSACHASAGTIALYRANFIYPGHGRFWTLSKAVSYTGEWDNGTCLYVSTLDAHLPGEDITYGAFGTKLALQVHTASPWGPVLQPFIAAIE